MSQLSRATSIFSSRCVPALSLRMRLGCLEWLPPTAPIWESTPCWTGRGTESKYWRDWLGGFYSNKESGWKMVALFRILPFSSRVPLPSSIPLPRAPCRPPGFSAFSYHGPVLWRISGHLTQTGQAGRLLPPSCAPGAGMPSIWHKPGTLCWRAPPLPLPQGHVTPPIDP